VLMSVPLRLPDWQTAILRGLCRLPRFVRRHRLATLRKRDGSDVTDARVREENPSLREMPLAGLCELVALAEQARRDLSHVTVPALVAHGERDRTVPQSASFELAGSLASATVERVWLPRSGHLIAVDVERVQLCETTARFLSSHAHRLPTASNPNEKPTP